MVDRYPLTDAGHAAIERSRATEPERIVELLHTRVRRDLSVGTLTLSGAGLSVPDTGLPK